MKLCGSPPGRNEGWVIPPGQDARFVWKMEQVLDVYKRPFNPLHPVIGFDRSGEP